MPFRFFKKHLGARLAVFPDDQLPPNSLLCPSDFPKGKGRLAWFAWSWSLHPSDRYMCGGCGGVSRAITVWPGGIFTSSHCGPVPGLHTPGEECGFYPACLSVERAWDGKRIVRLGKFIELRCQHCATPQSDGKELLVNIAPLPNAYGVRDTSILCEKRYGKWGEHGYWMRCRLFDGDILFLEFPSIATPVSLHAL